MSKSINKSRLIIIFIMLLVAVLAGTFAWLNYRSVKSRMVLTIGNINSVMVTLEPYEYDGGLSPVSTYTSATSTYNSSTVVDGQEIILTKKSGNVVNVTATNNTTTAAEITFTYYINSIDSELANSNLKYTVVKGSTQVASGNFNGVSAGSQATIYTENLSGNTTGNYKIYLWLMSNGDQTGLIGKAIDITFGATIPDYPNS